MEAKENSDPRILVADQDVVLCVSARRALERLGFAVTLVHDGGDAIDLLGRESYDVVVVGAALPTLNGLQVLRAIKKQNSKTPVILLGNAAPEVSELAVRDGAFAYLPVPADGFRELLLTVDRAIMMRETSSPASEKAETAPAAAPHVSDDTKLLGLLRELIESSRTRPVAQTMPLLLQATATAVRAEHSVVLLTQEETGLQLDSALGFSDQAAAARDFVANVGETFAWRVASERKTLIEQNPARESKTPSWFIGTPLAVRDQLLGVLVVYPLSAGTVEPVRVSWLELLAAQGAIAIYLSQLDTENERLSQTDRVTGALRRSVFLDLADHEFRRSWRYSQPISAIILDVDGMSDINVGSGREFGDRVLHEVANVCRGIVRSIDLLGRYKDDSFALLLLMTDHEGAKSAAERLRDGIRSIELSDPRGPVRLSATLGVCAYPREGCASIFDLLSVALEAQRAARRSGTNQIVCV